MIYRWMHFEPDTSPHTMAIELTKLQDRYPMAQFHWYVHPTDKGVGVLATNSVEPPDESAAAAAWWRYSELWWLDEDGDAEAQMLWARQWKVIPAGVERRLGA